MTTNHEKTYCFVPECKSTKKNAPDKLFFAVPTNKVTRKKWCEIVHRQNSIASAAAWCCQDHFSLENDVENWMRFRLLKEAGQKVFRLSLKKGVVPHIFDCQPKRTLSHTKAPRSVLVKRQLAETVAQALSNAAETESINHESVACTVAQSSDASDIISEERLYAAGPSTSQQGCVLSEISMVSSETSILSSSLHEVMLETSISSIDMSTFSGDTSGRGSNLPLLQQEQKREGVNSGCQANGVKPHCRSKAVSPVPVVSDQETLSSLHEVSLETSISSVDMSTLSGSTSGSDLPPLQRKKKRKGKNFGCQVNQKKPHCRSKAVSAVPTMTDQEVQTTERCQCFMELVADSTETVEPVPDLEVSIAEDPLNVSASTSVLNAESLTEEDFHNISISTVFNLNSSVPDAGCLDDETSSEEEDTLELEYHQALARDSTMYMMENDPRMFLGIDPEHLSSVLAAFENYTKLKKVSIFIALRKLRLHEPDERLATFFSRHQTSISKTIRKTIPILAEFFKTLIFWPEKDIIQANVPLAFRAKYSKVQSIVDCFEIEIEKPTDAAEQCLSWSSYKGTNTVKYLISCTPDGLINYVSKGYTGRGTDSEIIKICGFFDALKQNASVMADRGFKFIDSELTRKNCTLEKPDSVEKNTKLSQSKVRHSRSIASLRIHVERVIRRIREYKACDLHARLNHNFLALVDDAVIIVCGLVNLQGPLIM